MRQGVLSIAYVCQEDLKKACEILEAFESQKISQSQLREAIAQKKPLTPPKTNDPHKKEEKNPKLPTNPPQNTRSEGLIEYL